MKLDGGIFWGSLLVIIGILVILRYTLHLNISIFRIVIAIIFIYLGISLIVGQVGARSGSNIIFSEGTIKPGVLEKEYNIVFGRGYIDLTGIAQSELEKSIKIATVFANTTLKIDPNMPIEIDIDCAFGNTIMPDGTSVSFGDRIYRTPSISSSQSYLKIKADTVFGVLEIIQ
ncbi:MAG: hypothetical protein N2380_08545 [bacterium]|nr:hypothetical protein [bacterium]